MKKKVFLLLIFFSFCGVWVYAKKRSKATVQKQQQKVNTSATLVEKPIEEKIDEEAKRKSTIALVERGLEFLKRNSLEEACSKFSHTKEFLDGELYIFMFDLTGVVMAHGEQENLIWSNLSELRDTFGTPIFQEIVKASSAEGDSWATYEWRGATKKSYVRTISKNGKSYIIGSGYYSHSKKDAVVNLVKAAVALVNQVLKEKRPIVQAFSDLSYPLGKFVYGDLYLYALDFYGNIMAQGDRPDLIGTNALNYKDTTGKFVNKTIISKLKETNEGVWVEYISKRAKKMAYAEKVKDLDGKEYFIACGYYPDADRKAVVDLVQKGYVYMKQNGLSAAEDQFTDETVEDFRYGDLYLFVYDMKGICRAHGGNRALVGKNFYDEQDESGNYYVREMIKKADKSGKGWINVKLKKAFASIYVEKIDLGIQSYVIGSMLYPISKAETMDLLVKSAVSHLKNWDRNAALEAFVKRNGEFINGDLGVFVIDDTGLCYAWQDEYHLIWRNLIGLKDEDGKPFIKLFINSVNRGATKVSYKLNQRRVVASIAPVKKDKINYVVGSYFYK